MIKLPVCILALCQLTSAAVSTLVGSVSQNSTASGTSLVVTLSQSTTAGNALLIVVGTAAFGRTFTLSDSGGGTTSSYTLVDNDTTNNTVAHYYRLNVPGGLTSFTFAISSSASALWCIIHEVSGLLTSGALDQHTINTGTGSNLTSGATGTTTQANEYVFCYGNSAAETFTNVNDTSYTMRGATPSAPSSRLATADKHVGTIGAQTGQMKTSGIHTYFCGVATYKDSGLGGALVILQE